jgi:Lysozyme like domain
MAVLTVAQAATYAQQAGFSGAGLQTIVAIAQGESGLNTQAINSADPNGGSYGVLQINGAHFGTQWSGGIMSQSAAFDPATSFKYAYVLSGGGKNFTPWGAYTNGSYAKYMGQAVGVNAPLGSGIPGSSTAASGTGGLATNPTTTASNPALDAISSLLGGQLGQWISSPARIIKLVVGMILIGISLYMLIEPHATAIVQTVAKTAAKVGIV